MGLGIAPRRGYVVWDRSEEVELSRWDNFKFKLDKELKTSHIKCSYCRTNYNNDEYIPCNCINCGAPLQRI